MKNNIDNISKFINALGFIPNANYIANRSAAVLYPMVYGFYKKSGYKSIIVGYIGTIPKEYEFRHTEADAIAFG